MQRTQNSQCHHLHLNFTLTVYQRFRCHAHSVYGKAWSVFGKELDMITQDSIRFYKSHGVYKQFGGVVLASEEGERIADALGT